MARAWNRLTANFVRGVIKRGRYADGGGLYLQVAKGGTRAWTFLFTRNGASRAMGLGSMRTVSLALARELAADAREKLARGFDPIDARHAAALAQQAARAKLTTFKQAAEEFYAANKTRWTNEKHRREWYSAVSRFGYPILGNLSVDSIDSGHVCKVLAPLVAEKHVTAARLRGRIETVLDYARAAGWRTGDNPADKTVISHMLPLRSEKDGVVHQPALPFAQLPGLMQVLRATEGSDARFLEMIALSLIRSEAVRQARFGEFDLAERVWTIPLGRQGMKRLGRAHRVPLTDRMVEIVEGLRQAQPEGPFVFGGLDPVSDACARELLAKLLTSLGLAHAVPHGLRSALKDWAHETRDYPTEVVEQVLGHRIKSSVEAAYRRGDLFNRRKILMADWDDFCAGNNVTGGGIIKLRA
jgi:integrase